MTALGPENGTLTVRTGKAGAASKAGHNLVIEVTRWQGKLSPETVELTADARSLRVRSGSGGISPLGDEEKAGISQTIDEEVLEGGNISYRSSAVSERPDGYDVEGELDLLGVRAPLSFALSLDGDHLTGTATVKQTDWRIKPYSALFGTLKVADVVEVSIDATLPRSPSDG
jgi:YceI-like protein